MEKKIECVVVGPIETNCWLYPLDENPGPGGKIRCAVIDPGDEGGLIIARIKELNWVPEYILLTHGHYDHLTALPELLEACGKSGWSPKTGIHRLDANYLKKTAPNLYLEEGDEAGPLKVLHVPGHTQGCAAFYDEKAGVLFSGDTLFKRDYGRTDLPGGSWDQLKMSLKRLLSMKEEIIVCPGHGDGTTIKEEVAFFLSDLEGDVLTP